MPKDKTPKPGSEFSRDREFGAILEEIRSDFRAFGEGLSELQEKVGGLSERMEEVEQKLDHVGLEIKAIKSTMATKKDLEKLAEEFNKRLIVVETR